jgi:glycosyltransferase involved in cell wall biosynthesis
MPGRVAILTPFAVPSVRGNAVTVERIARGLGERGVDARVWDLSAMPERRIEREVDAARPGLVHAFHAHRAGPLALRLAQRADVPLVVTLTGTDANHDLFDTDRSPVVRAVLEGAAGIVAFHHSIAARVAAAAPAVAARVVVIPQSSRLEAEPYDLAASWPLPPDRVLFLFPGGIRPVKRPRLPIAPLARLVARHPSVRLAYAGPILDPSEGEALLREVAPHPWVRYLGPVPHAQMGSLMRQADVVLNCSQSEGGMANAVLEAFATGRAVLASDIEGNRSLVEDGVTGLLFRDADELQGAAERLTMDPALRGRLGRAAEERARRDYPPGREVDRHLTLYRRLTPALT